MSAHTPGPWTAEVVDESDMYTEWKIAPNVCSVYYVNETGEANARLIAAAPELLEALESVEMRLTHLAQDSQSVAHELKIVRAAIAKATGKA